MCNEKSPILGHKTAPLPSRFPGFDFVRFFGNPEIMHGKHKLMVRTRYNREQYKIEHSTRFPRSKLSHSHTVRGGEQTDRLEFRVYG